MILSNHSSKIHRFALRKLRPKPHIPQQPNRRQPHIANALRLQRQHLDFFGPPIARNLEQSTDVTPGLFGGDIVSAITPTVLITTRAFCNKSDFLSTIVLNQLIFISSALSALAFLSEQSLYIGIIQ